jgi:hypothetical protein
MGLTDNDEVLSLITAILWLSNPASTQLGLPVSPVGRYGGFPGGRRRSDGGGDGQK